MDPATLVVQALVSGASAGLGETASAAVADAYGALKALLAGRLTGRRKALDHLDAVETGTGVRGAELAAELNAAGAVDTSVLDVATRLLALLDPDGTQLGKYQVHLPGAKGVQIGDGNTQHNTFQ